MTDEQILKLAETCGFDSFTGEIENFWECWEEQLLKFALAIHEDGYNKGYEEAWREGYNVGVIEYQE